MNVFQEAYLAWVDTWKTNRKLFWLEFTGTLVGIISALIIDILAKNPPMLIVMWGYFISAVLLAKASHIRRSPFILLLMSFYAFSSTYGLYVLYT